MFPVWRARAPIRRAAIIAGIVSVAAGVALISQLSQLSAAPQMLSASFTPQVLKPVGSDAPGAITPEPPLELRLFDTAVMTD